MHRHFRFFRPFISQCQPCTQARAFSSRPPPNTQRTWVRKLTIVSAGATCVFLGDKYLNSESLTRTIRTFIFGVQLAIDFKFRFDSDDAAKVQEIHVRTAERFRRLCMTNGGLYIKMAQATAIQSAILPEPYRIALANVFDKADSIPYDQVEKVFYRNFNKQPEEVFESFEQEPFASASIAQVHKARLLRKEGQSEWGPDEGWVAVKVRKPAVGVQVQWDLGSIRALLWAYEKMFDIPMSFISKEVTSQVRKELDLYHEAQNANRTRKNIEKESSLRGKVVVPAVHWDLTTTEVMTAEFIDNTCRLIDKRAITEMKLSVKTAMDLTLNTWAAMIFKWGFVHSDPHPGNVLVREHPKHPGQTQIVIVDHGLYVEFSEEFRKDYSELWDALFVLDRPKIEKVVKKWGISSENSSVFASMTMLRPQSLDKNSESHLKLTAEETKGSMEKKFKEILQAEELIPRELILLGRAMRMLQGNNQQLGSPSNRINIMAHWAKKSTLSQINNRHAFLSPSFILDTIKQQLGLFVFRCLLFVVDLGFYIAQFRQYISSYFGYTKNVGFEDVLEKHMRAIMKKEYGMDVGEASLFSG